VVGTQVEMVIVERIGAGEVAEYGGGDTTPLGAPVPDGWLDGV